MIEKNHYLAKQVGGGGGGGCPSIHTCWLFALTRHLDDIQKRTLTLCVTYKKPCKQHSLEIDKFLFEFYDTNES